MPSKGLKDQLFGSYQLFGSCIFTCFHAKKIQISEELIALKHEL